MKTLDVTDIHEGTKLMNPGVDFDGNYTFYYDETNNIKKLHLKGGDFNVAFTSNFILGGLCFSGVKPNISDVFDGIKLQDNVKEVKFKHLATGGFLDCLKSNKLASFLTYIVNSPLYLHYSSLNLLYFSIVDIVDSMLNNTDQYEHHGFGFNRYLKNILYKVCKQNIKSITDLFFILDYPNISRENLNEFIKELAKIIEDYKPSVEDNYGLSALKILLKKSLNESLIFVQDETDHLLIGGLDHFYWRPVYSFGNSSHHFDNEDDIKKEMENLNIIVSGKVISNYTFSDSKDDVYTQCSDIIVGLIGKLSKFINTNSKEQIVEIVESLNSQQLINLDLYLDLYVKSLKRNIGFIHSTDSDEELLKHNLLCDLRGKNI